MICLNIVAVTLLVSFTRGDETSKECEKNHGSVNWQFQTQNGQNVNYMPVMPMAMPIVQGAKGEPGTCDSSQCKCDCDNIILNRGSRNQHTRRALRGTADNQFRRDSKTQYRGGHKPQELRAPISKGSKGEKGDQGEMGPAGLSGMRGPKGEPGTSGIHGTRTGYQRSPKGDRGPTGIRGFPGSTGIRGPPGPMGPPGRHGRPGSPGRTGKDGSLGRPGLPGTSGKKGEPGVPGSGTNSAQKRVAFTAALTENVGPVQLATPLKFKDVILNEGAAYNLITGLFTVPYNGTYVVSYNALSQYGRALELTLLHNARIISSVHSRQTGGYAGAGNSIAVRLMAGDRLWMELSAGIYYVYGDTGRHTVLSAYMLYAD